MLQLDTTPKSPNEFGSADAMMLSSALATAFLALANRRLDDPPVSSRADLRSPVGDIRVNAP